MFEKFTVICNKCGGDSKLESSENIYHDITYVVVCRNCENEEVKTVDFKWEV